MIFDPRSSRMPPNRSLVVHVSSQNKAKYKCNLVIRKDAHEKTIEIDLVAQHK
jgi:hypothetical protein